MFGFESKKNSQNRSCTPATIRLSEGSEQPNFPISNADSIVVGIAVGLERLNFRNSYHDVMRCNQPNLSLYENIGYFSNNSNAWQYIQTF